MKADSDTIRLEDLMAHAAWVRGLAHSLVADAHTAEDVVQDTWLAALRTPPLEDRNLRAWLGRVVSNFARQRGRGAARRSEREDAVQAQREPIESPEELAQRVETQRNVATLVLELDEPFRQTVLLRYYEGLSSPEIARRMKVPAGTVRWRLSNAIRVLRDRLDREYGNREAWSLLLAPLAGREASLVAPTSAGASATLQGILAMHTGWKVAIAALAVLSVIAFAPLGRMVAEFSSDAEISELPEAEPVAIAEASDELPPNSADGARVSVEPGGAETSVAEVATVPAFTGVALRVLDPEGHSLADVSVELHSTRALFGKPVSSARTDAGGRVTVELIGELDADASYSVVIDDPRYLRHGATIPIVEYAVEQLGDVTLGAAGSIQGRVVDAARRPVSGASVDVDRLDSEFGRGRLEEERIMRTVRGVRPGLAGVASDGEKKTTDERGFFRLDRVATGVHSLWSWSEGHLAGCVRPVEIRAGAVTEGVVIELGVRDPADFFIQGVVLGPDGRPEASARVKMKHPDGDGPSVRRSYRTDSRGRFVLPWLPAVPLTLVVSDRASKWTPIVHAGVEGGVEELVLRFTEARPQEELALTLVGPDGPARGAVIYVYDERHDNQLLLPQDVASLGGVYRFAVPVEPYVVDILCEGHDFGRAGPFAGLAGPREVTVELRSLPGVRGRVLASGAPVPGARVYLSEAASQKTWNCGFPVRVTARPAAWTTGDESGEFALTLRWSGSFYLRAETDGLAPAELGPLFIDKERGAQGLEIELSNGGAIEGRVLPLPGGSPAGVIVAISRGDARATSRRVGEDGSFRFENLMPGPWLVVRHDEEVHPWDQMSMIEALPFDEAEIRTNCTVVEGRTTRYDLDLAGEAAEMVLEGCLIIDSRPARGWRVRLARPSVSLFPTGSLGTVLDEEGRFRIASPRSSRAHLVLNRVDGAGLFLSVPLDLHPGHNEWRCSLNTGELVIENPAPPGDNGMPIDHYFGTAEGVEVEVGLYPGENDAARLTGVPAGQGQIVRITYEQSGESGEPYPKTWSSSWT